MSKVTVHATRAYDVLIDRGILSRTGSEILKTHAPCKAAIITDDTVERLYCDAVAVSLTGSGFEASCFTFPSGEKSKTLETYGNMLDFLAKSGITRSDIIVALGGGVTGDLAGFAAATYQRGIDFIHIPTTYLAAVDSSVGGKTGLNLSAGKNLCGAFYQPILVLIDCDTFKTLPNERFADGIAETIKYGVIADKSLFDIMKTGGLTETCRLTETGEFKETGDLTEFCESTGLSEFNETGGLTELVGLNKQIEGIVARCVQIKSEFVAQDEHDNGARRLLNFGHTFGHAIEKCSNYSISHGHAVGIGMLMAAKAAYRLGLSAENCAPQIAAALEANALPMRVDYGIDEFADAMLGDKKRRGGTISLILPDSIGDCRIHDVSVDMLRDFVVSAVERQ